MYSLSSLGSDVRERSFNQNGFYHYSKLIPEDLCQALTFLFSRDVKPYNGALLRQRSVTYEPHKLTSCNFMENALLDIHRPDITLFSDFTQAALDVFSLSSLLKHVGRFLGEEPVLVQSMYFESSKGTPEHFDKFFLGVSDQDPMLGVWIALEDIDPCAGELYKYTGSHLQQFEGHHNQAELQALLHYYREQNAIAVNGHQGDSQRSQLKAVMECKRTLRKLIRQAGWQKWVPEMKQGDVIFFSTNTLHGSNSPEIEHGTRNSLTGHFVSEKQTCVRYGDVMESVRMACYQGVKMHLSHRYTYLDMETTDNARVE